MHLIAIRVCLRNIRPSVTCNLLKTGVGTRWISWCRKELSSGSDSEMGYWTTSLFIYTGLGEANR